MLNLSGLTVLAPCPSCANPSKLTVKLDDIHNGTIEGNNFSGSGDKAIFITPLSMGWKVQNNQLGSGYSALQ